MTFTKVQASGEQPFTVTVGQDDKATIGNVKAFIDAFNKLRNVLATLTKPGDKAKEIAGGAFAHDGGVRALNDRLTALLRPSSGESLAAYGIVATRSGTLELDESRLLAQLKRNPTGLDAMIGSTVAASPSGIAGGLDNYLKTWNNGVNGQIKLRREQTTTLQTRLADRQATLDLQHKAAYDRYLKQFTQLQAMQGQMNHNVSLFDALFGTEKAHLSCPIRKPTAATTPSTWMRRPRAPRRSNWCCCSPTACSTSWRARAPTSSGAATKPRRPASTSASRSSTACRVRLTSTAAARPSPTWRASMISAPPACTAPASSSTRRWWTK